MKFFCISTCHPDGWDSKWDSIEEGELRDGHMEITIRREDSRENSREEDDSLAIRSPQPMSLKEKFHHIKMKRERENVDIVSIQQEGSTPKGKRAQISRAPQRTGQSTSGVVKTEAARDGKEALQERVDH